jgi:hypothetical protein
VTDADAELSYLALGIVQQLDPQTVQIELYQDAQYQGAGAHLFATASSGIDRGGG